MWLLELKFSRITGHILEFPGKDFVVNKSRNITEPSVILGFFRRGVLFFTVMKVFLIHTNALIFWSCMQENIKWWNIQFPTPTGQYSTGYQHISCSANRHEIRIFWNWATCGKQLLGNCLFRLFYKRYFLNPRFYASVYCIYKINLVQISSGNSVELCWVSLYNITKHLLTQNTTYNYAIWRAGMMRILLLKCLHLSLVSQYVYAHRKLVDKEILTARDVSSPQNFSTCLLALKVVSATVGG